jgi:hypothetical protein
MCRAVTLSRTEQCNAGYRPPRHGRTGPHTRRARVGGLFTLVATVMDGQHDRPLWPTAVGIGGTLAFARAVLIPKLVRVVADVVKRLFRDAGVAGMKAAKKRGTHVGRRGFTSC